MGLETELTFTRMCLFEVAEAPAAAPGTRNRAYVHEDAFFWGGWSACGSAGDSKHSYEFLPQELPNMFFFTNRVENRDMELLTNGFCVKFRCASCACREISKNLLLRNWVRWIPKMLTDPVGVFSGPSDPPKCHIEKKTNKTYTNNTSENTTWQKDPKQRILWFVSVCVWFVLYMAFGRVWWSGKYSHRVR